MSQYDKSVIKIDINFENEAPLQGKPPRPVFPKKVRKDRITLIQPSSEAQKTGAVIEKRLKELEKFRRESLSAIEAPLLMTALVKKTNERLSLILVRTAPRRASDVTRADVTVRECTHNFSAALQANLQLLLGDCSSHTPERSKTTDNQTNVDSKELKAIRSLFFPFEQLSLIII